MKIVLTTDTHWGYSEKGDRANILMLEQIRKEVPAPFTLLHTGDLGNHERHHREDYLLLLNDYFPDCYLGAVTGNHDCLDEATECLTHRGWVTYDQIQNSDKVFSFNSQTNRGEWHPITAKIVKPAPTTMNLLEGRTTSMAVTDNHRVLWRGNSSNSPWRYTTISELPDMSVQFKVATTEGNSDYPISDALIQACAWFLTDGSIVQKQPSHSPTYVIWQSKPIQHILDILDEAGLAYKVSERDRDIQEVCGKKLLKAPLSEKRITLDFESARKMDNILPSKAVPDWLMNKISDRQFFLFEKEMVLANGSKNKAYPRSYALYGTQGMLTQFQLMMVRHSRRANLKRDTRGNYLLRVNVKEYTQINPKSCLSTIPSHPQSVVWCISTPLTNFMVKHEGSPFFTGNCWTATKVPHWRIDDVIRENKYFFEQAGVHYLNNSPIDVDGVFITGFNGWYHDTQVTHESYIPHRGDPSDGVARLARYAYQDFQKCLSLLQEAKSRGSRTVLCTHMGFVESASKDDWKATQSAYKGIVPYFGANPTWEGYLDNVDYLFYGHSHTAFDGLAKNGKTRVINAGSDYQNPKFKVLEV